MRVRVGGGEQEGATRICSLRSFLYGLITFGSVSRTVQMVHFPPRDLAALKYSPLIATRTQPRPRESSI